MTSIALDEIVESAGSYGFTSTVTLNKVTSSAPTAAVMLFYSTDGGPFAHPTSATYGGVAMTLSQGIGPDGAISFSCAKLLNPPSGPQSIVLSYSTAGLKNLYGALVTWTGSILSVDEIYQGVRAGQIPTLSIAKAETSAMMGCVIPYGGGLDSLGVEYFGDGAEIYRFEFFGLAKQEPSEGTGAMDWEIFDPMDSMYYPLTCEGVTVEIVAIPPVAGANPISLMAGA